MISVKNLTKYYGDKLAVKNISFEIKKGEIVGLLGLNGSGKTTTIRMLSCYLIPSEGEIQIDSEDLFSNPLHIKKKIGYLPETVPLYEDLTVKEYLTFGARLKSIEQTQIEQEVNRVCEKADIVSKKDSLISHLSLGYRKRVGIAQTLIGNPSVIIMDEPISGLDPKQIVEIRNLIKSLAKNHTVLLSSHVLSEVQKTCDRFLFIKEGELVLDYKQNELEEQIHKLSYLLLTVQGKDKNYCESIIKNALLENDTIQLDSEDENGFTYQIRSKEENQFKEKLIPEILKKDIHLQSLKKQEITLEEIFNKLNS